MSLIEYLIPTDNILMLLLHLNLILKSSHMDGFKYEFMIIQKLLTFYWVTCRLSYSWNGFFN